MKEHSETIRQQVLSLLRQNRGPKEIAKRLNLAIGTIDMWATEWRKTGVLAVYKRPGMEFANRAKEISKGFYRNIRKRYLGMRWADRLAKREFGFKSPVEAIPYYLDETGTPRVCAYCGRAPGNGKVWGLDRIDSSIGHVPGNLVPCCGAHPESPYLSCQASKSKFSLTSWMEMSLSRAKGRPVSAEEVQERLAQIYSLAKNLVAH